MQHGRSSYRGEHNGEAAQETREQDAGDTRGVYVSVIREIGIGVYIRRIHRIVTAGNSDGLKIEEKNIN